MNLSGMDFNLLKVLDALIAERSVTRAGRRLGRSQPAVSNALNRLRLQLNDELLVRGPHGFVLTPRAEAIRDPLREAIRLVESCISAATPFDPGQAQGAFRLSMPDRLSLSIVPPLFARLQELAPRMALQVLTAERGQALDLLDADRIDLALGWFDQKPGHVNAERIGEEGLFCVLRPGHPILRARKKFDIESVLSYPHLVVSATGQRTAIFDDLLMRHGLRRRAAVAVSNFTAVPLLLMRSDMIGVFAKPAADVFENSFDLVKRPAPIDVGKVAVNMVWRMRDDKDPQQAWLRGQIRTIYRGL